MVLQQAGADIDVGDYDKRTPLHLAAVGGQVNAVEFLLKNGAKANVVDRFGSTPLQDSFRGLGRNHKNVQKVLLEYGAVAYDTQQQFGGPLLTASILQSLPLVLARSGAAMVEAFLPTRNGKEFQLIHTLARNNLADADLTAFAKTQTSHTILNKETNILGRAWGSHRAVVQSREDVKDRVTEESLTIAESIAVPIIYEGDCYGVLVFHTNAEAPGDLSSESLDYFTTISSRIIEAGVFSRLRNPIFEQVAGITPAGEEAPDGQAAEVYHMIVLEGVFNASIVYDEVERFYNMGFQLYFFQRFSSRVLANQIHSYIAAKMFANATHVPEHISVHIENNPRFHSSSQEQALFIVEDEYEEKLSVERRLEELIARIPDSKAYSLEYFKSSEPAVHNGKSAVSIYVLETSDYANPISVQNDGETVTDFHLLPINDCANRCPSVLRAPPVLTALLCLHTNCSRDLYLWHLHSYAVDLGGGQRGLPQHQDLGCARPLPRSHQRMCRKDLAGDACL
jgi:hypothetical protein